MLKIYNKESKDCNTNIHFLHGNSMTPDSYKNLLTELSQKNIVKTSLLRPLWDHSQPPTFKNWDIFLNDYIDSIKNENKIIGIGHSIGGNLLLKSALITPEKFEKIILLDPTFFTPFKIKIWKILARFNLQSKFLPLINSAENKKMQYPSIDEMYKSYRRYKIFHNFSDQDLRILVKSLIKNEYNKVKLLFDNKWDAQIYRTGLINDMFIWRNIKKLKVKTLIIRAEFSDVFLNKTSNLVRKKNKHIDIQILKKSDHLFPINNYKETFKIINSFI